MTNCDNLKDTVVGMISPDYKERFKAEYNQLYIRLTKLNRFINNYKSNKLDFKPKCSLSIYEAQSEAMQKYLNILDERAKLEEIK